MKVSCIIVDDEQAARNGLAADIREIDYLQIMALIANVPDALDKIKEYTPDLIFLDIEMPGSSGIDFLNQTRVKPLVIITTAYPQFALHGFDPTGAATRNPTTINAVNSREKMPRPPLHRADACSLR